MDMESQPVLMEPEDLLKMPDGDHYELIDGIPVEKTMGAKSDRIALRLGGRMDQHCFRNQGGLVFGSQTGYRCFPHNPRQLRKPDVSFVGPGRFPDDEAPEGDILLAPDITVEVVSPNDFYEEIETKIADYRAAGVKLIWVISPKARTVVIRRLDGSCAELNEAGELSGEDVLPGFTCKVAELFV